MNRQVRFTGFGMEDAGVALLNRHSVWLRCQRCGQPWSPQLATGRRFPRGWWKCPNGCNGSCAGPRRGLKETL